MPITDSLQDRFEAAIERDDPFELQRVILEVAHEAENREWAEVCCARLTRHRNANVRGNALHGLGHLARRFGQLDRRRVQRLIEIGLHAHNEVVRAGAESAAEDAETYLAWSFERARE